MHLGVVILGHCTLISGVVGQLLQNGFIGYRRGYGSGVDVHAVFAVVAIKGVQRALKAVRDVVHGILVEYSGDEEFIAADPYHNIAVAGRI